MKLTATTVKTAELERGKSEAIFFDDDIPGFGLRLRQSGSKNFIFQYKHGDKHRRMALGKATAVTILNARKTAEKLYARARLGEDPATDKIEAQRQASETFKPDADEFLEVLRERYRPRAFKEIERHLTKHAKPLHQLQVAKITHRDVADLIAAVTKQSGPVTANRLRTSLSTFFAWLIQRGRAPANPVINVEKNPEQSRDRCLTPHEFRLIWNALGQGQYEAVVKLLALTGQRASEIANLRWSEIHDDQIILPPERTKNGRPHVVPLSPIAMQIIEAQGGDNGRDLIFGRGEGGFSGWSKSKERVDQAVSEANGGKPIAPWVLHDLRRTLASYLGGGLPEHQLKKLPPKDRDAASGLGIEPHVIEAVLNHVSGTKAGIVGVYQRGTYPREKKAALDLWSDRLLAIVEGRKSNVTALRREG
jgi:integrase